ncbi:MAG: HlyD family efflux transporter periplasmic adaptor subunit [Planctomycetota bacterium]
MSTQATLRATESAEVPSSKREAESPLAEKKDSYRVEWETSFQIAQLMQERSLSAAQYRHAFRLIVEHFRSPYARLYLKIPNVVAENITDGPDATGVWETAVTDASLEAQTKNRPIGRRFSLRSHGQEAAVLASPIYGESGGPSGAIGLVVHSKGNDYAQRCLGELTALATILSQAGVRQTEQTTVEDDRSLKRAMVKAADFESLHELAFAMTNSMKKKFGCKQVALGQAIRGRIHLLSISGLDEIPKESPGTRTLCQAMEECMDCDSILCSQDEDRWAGEESTSNHLLHRRWAESLGGEAVASVPLKIEKDCIAVISFTRSQDKPFTERELKEIDKAVAPFSAAIQLVSKAERSLMSHGADEIRHAVHWVMEPGTPRRKLVLGMFAILIAAFFVVRLDYRMTLPSSVVPAELRYVSSPFDATIQSCVVEVGDVIEQGQLLCTLDAAEILLLLDEAKSEQRATSLRLTSALDQGDVKAAAIAGAELRVIQSKIEIAQLRLQNTELRAPCDGTIVAGNVSQRIGETIPLGDTLFELVPHGDWELRLHAAESIVADLQPGQTGYFSSNARPEASLDCEVQGVLPGAQAVDGESVYYVDAVLKENPDWLRSGMEGVTRVRAGERPLWWIASHRLIDQFHRLFWF